MSYRGHIHEGVVVFDEQVPLPEGTKVKVDLLEQASPEATDDRAPSLAKRLASVIGKAQELPPDASLNHDHYLYGLPKK